MQRDRLPLIPPTGGRPKTAAPNRGSGEQVITLLPLVSPPPPWPPDATTRGTGSPSEEELARKLTQLERDLAAKSQDLEHLQAEIAELKVDFHRHGELERLRRDKKILTELLRQRIPPPSEACWKDYATTLQEENESLRRELRRTGGPCSCQESREEVCRETRQVFQREHSSRMEKELLRRNTELQRQTELSLQLGETLSRLEADHQKEKEALQARLDETKESLAALEEDYQAIEQSHTSTKEQYHSLYVGLLETVWLGLGSDHSTEPGNPAHTLSSAVSQLAQECQALRDTRLREDHQIAAFIRVLSSLQSQAEQSGGYSSTLLESGLGPLKALPSEGRLKGLQTALGAQLEGWGTWLGRVEEGLGSLTHSTSNILESIETLQQLDQFAPDSLDEENKPTTLALQSEGEPTAPDSLAPATADDSAKTPDGMEELAEDSPVAEITMQPEVAHFYLQTPPSQDDEVLQRVEAQLLSQQDITTEEVSQQEDTEVNMEAEETSGDLSQQPEADVNPDPEETSEDHSQQAEAEGNLEPEVSPGDLSQHVEAEVNSNPEEISGDLSQQAEAEVNPDPEETSEDYSQQAEAEGNLEPEVRPGDLSQHAEGSVEKNEADDVSQPVEASSEQEEPAEEIGEEEVNGNDGVTNELEGQNDEDSLMADAIIPSVEIDNLGEEPGCGTQSSGISKELLVSPEIKTNSNDDISESEEERTIIQNEESRLPTEVSQDETTEGPSIEIQVSSMAEVKDCPGGLDVYMPLPDDSGYQGSEPEEHSECDGREPLSLDQSDRLEGAAVGDVPFVRDTSSAYSSLEAVPWTSGGPFRDSFPRPDNPSMEAGVQVEDPRIHDLEMRLEEMEGVRRQHMAAACEVGQALARAQQDWAHRDACYRDEIAAWRDSTEQLTVTLRRISTDLEAAQQIVVERDQRLEQLEAIKMDLENRVTQLSTQLAKASPPTASKSLQTCDTSYVRYRTLQDSVRELSAEKELYQRELSEARQALQEVSARLRTAEETLSHHQAMMAARVRPAPGTSREELMKNKEVQVRRLQTELARLTSETEGKETIIGQQRKEIRQLNGRVLQLDRQLTSLRSRQLLHRPPPMEVSFPHDNSSAQPRPAETPPGPSSSQSLEEFLKVTEAAYGELVEGISSELGLPTPATPPPATPEGLMETRRSQISALLGALRESSNLRRLEARASNAEKVVKKLIADGESKEQHVVRLRRMMRFLQDTLDSERSFNHVSKGKWSGFLTNRLASSRQLAILERSLEKKKKDIVRTELKLESLSANLPSSQEDGLL